MVSLSTCSLHFQVYCYEYQLAVDLLKKLSLFDKLYDERFFELILNYKHNYPSTLNFFEHDLVLFFSVILSLFV